MIWGCSRRKRGDDLAVIQYSEIQRRLGLSIKDRASLVITPFLNEKDAFSVDSVDLRLGCHFLLPQVPPLPYATLDSEHPRTVPLHVHIPWGKYLVVPAHQTVLGVTLEFIKLPCDLSGQILTKSSIARTFVVIETAPWIHPSYRGCLTLEIANVSNTPLLLHPGVRIGQLVLQAISPRPDPNEDVKLKGNYLGPVFPEAPKFKSLKDELGGIGILEPELPEI
jgi:dCTP deaminase